MEKVLVRVFSPALSTEFCPALSTVLCTALSTVLCKSLSTVFRPAFSTVFCPALSTVSCSALSTELCPALTTVFRLLSLRPEGIFKNVQNLSLVEISKRRLLSHRTIPEVVCMLKSFQPQNQSLVPHVVSSILATHRRREKLGNYIFCTR